jgi:hypothetical protein
MADRKKYQHPYSLTCPPINLINHALISCVIDNITDTQPNKEELCMNIFLWIHFKITNAISLCNVKDSLGFARQLSGWPDPAAQSISHSNTQTDKHETEPSHEYKLNHAGQKRSNKH